MKNISSNIWKYTLFLISNKRVFVAIIGVYYLSINGVGTKEIGYILLASNIAGFIFEIPSGVLSDKIGHKNSLVISRVLMLISSLIFLLASNLMMLIGASIFMSLGVAFTSGTGAAFLHDTLKVLGRESEYAEISGKVKSISFAVPLLISSLVPFLVDINIRAPFAIGIIIDIVGLLTAMTFINPKSNGQEIEEINPMNFRSILFEGKASGFNKLALLTGTIYGMVAAVSMFRSPYQEVLLVPVIYFGVFFGIGRLLASGLLVKSGAIKEKLSMNSFFLFQIVFFLSTFLILGLVNSAWIVVAIFLIQNGVKWGFSQVEIAYLMDTIKGSTHKATLLSVKAQIGQISAGISGFVLGYLINDLGYMDGFLIFGVIFALIAGVLYLYYLNNNKFK